VVVRDLRINGLSVGEGGMNALMARWFGVPVVLVTGDDVAIDEQRYTVQLELRDPTIPEVAAAFQEIRLVNLTPVEFTRASMPEAYRLIRVLYRFINTD
jgi:D-amino peptidase